jgi:hypothetical protein
MVVHKWESFQQYYEQTYGGGNKWAKKNTIR